MQYIKPVHNLRTCTALASQPQLSPLAALQHSDLFGEADAVDLAALIRRTRIKSAKAGDVLLYEDDPAPDSLFIIMEGGAKVILGDEKGRDTVIAVLETGDCFGELSLFDPAPVSATIRATEDCRILCIPRSAIFSVIEKSPRIATRLLQSVARKLRRTTHRLGSLARHGVEPRVAHAVMELLEERGMRSREPDGRQVAVIRDCPTRQFIADMSGIARESVCRTLASWERRGWVESRNRDLIIFNENALSKGR